VRARSETSSTRALFDVVAGDVVYEILYNIRLARVIKGGLT